MVASDSCILYEGYPENKFRLLTEVCQTGTGKQRAISRLIHHAFCITELHRVSYIIIIIIIIIMMIIIIK